MAFPIRRSPHTLTVGPTGSGKSTLQAWLSQKTYQRRGGGNILCAPRPKWDVRFAVSWRTDSVDTLLGILDKTQYQHVWIDEMPQMVQRGNPNHLRLATDMRGAPRFHCIHFIGTHLKQIEPQIRTNVGRYYLFFCALGLKSLIEETGDVRLERASTLKPGEFIVKDVMADPILYRIEDVERLKISAGEAL